MKKFYIIYQSIRGCLKALLHSMRAYQGSFLSLCRQFLILGPLFCFSQDCDSLFNDLDLVEIINREIQDELPFFYNYSFVGGYFTMPSARFPKSGMLAFGASSVSPYWIYGANFAVFRRIELAANYRVFSGMQETNFGHEGFGEDADRIGNVKFGILMPEDGFPFLPTIAFGLDDVIGTKRFSSHYFVFTKEWIACNVEFSIGYGWGRIKGFFGGISWTPFHATRALIVKNLSFIAEYDANNYKKHPTEHCKGREVSSRINGGFSYRLGDVLQVSLSSIRGKKIGGSASIQIPLGSTEGFFPKIHDPNFYTTPIDVEPIGYIRPEREFICDLVCIFAKQGFDVYQAYFFYNVKGSRSLYLQIVNTRYREESVVRKRIQDLLCALTPINVEEIKVVIEAEGVESHSYCFRTCDLYAYRECCMGGEELNILSPMRELGCRHNSYDTYVLFQRSREIWTVTTRPRIVSFFGSTSGKFKYSFGMLGSFEGFLPGGMIYRLQTVYSIYSSMHGLTNRDRLNPSKLPHVRTDTVKYYQEGRIRLEEFFFQKSWNLGRGWFSRFAMGYFEPAYGGIAAEILRFPVQANWAYGIDGGIVWKRTYSGLGFTSKITRFNNKGEDVKEHFLGIQCFFDLHYDFKPLDLLFGLKIGRFLAKDLGAKIEVTRYFPSGARFSLWVTATNGKDQVNHRNYFDKGFAFTIPFDFFLKKSSRTLLTYGMSAWLRDVGAIAATGKPLYPTLYEERYD